MDVLKRAAPSGPVSRIAAGDVERAVIDQLRAILRAPEIAVRTWRTARRKIDNITEAEVRDALDELDPLWDELFPAEQARIVQLLVKRVDIREDGVEIRFRVNGLASLVADLRAGDLHERRAA
jgi:site-specific DNA recombinase